jgi:hypothetical protein
MNNCKYCNEPIDNSKHYGRTKHFCNKKCRYSYWNREHEILKYNYALSVMDTVVANDLPYYTKERGLIWNLNKKTVFRLMKILGYKWNRKLYSWEYLNY